MIFDKTEHNFGNIEAGKIYTIVFKQSEDDDVARYLAVNTFNGGCGCTNAEYSPKNRTFTVGINRSQTGKFEKHPSIKWMNAETLQEEQLVFTIKGNVV